MAAEALEIRMARLEGASAQINERLGGVEREIGVLRLELRTEIGTIRSTIDNLRSEMKTQFYWTLTFILSSILIPILRDLAVAR